jgi:hypothetical protein
MIVVELVMEVVMWSTRTIPETSNKDIYIYVLTKAETTNFGTTALYVLVEHTFHAPVMTQLKTLVI